MRPYLLILSYAFLLAGVAHFIIYYPLSLALPLAILSPIIVFTCHSLKISPPYFNEVFGIIKLDLVSIGVLIVPLLTLGILPERHLSLVVNIILLANIAEAVGVDLKSALFHLKNASSESSASVKKHLLNVISGILLIIVFLPMDKIYWVKPYFVYAGSPGMIFWVLAYTLWNWNFVLLNFPKGRSFITIGFLLAPLIFSFAADQIGYWLLARAITLFVGQTVQGLVGSLTVLPYVKSDNYLHFVQKVEFLKIQALFYVTVTLLCIIFCLY